MGIAGCQSEHDGAPQEKTQQGNPDLVNFAVVKADFFDNYCIQCHSAAGGNKGGLNVETFARVEPLVSKIQARVNAGEMPPTGPVPPEARELLNTWIKNGAPELVSDEGVSGE